VFSLRKTAERRRVSNARSRIFEHARTHKEKVTEGWRQLRNEKLHNLYSSTNITKFSTSVGMGWAEHTESVGWLRISAQFSPEIHKKVKKLLDRRTATDLTETECKDVDWIQPAQSNAYWRWALVNMDIKLRGPWRCWIYWSGQLLSAK
jgi:hypothetical protein